MDKEKEQPKDYVIQNFEEAMEEAYHSLGVFEKILYRLQDNIVLVVLSCSVIGYIAGAYFGKFW